MGQQESAPSIDANMYSYDDDPELAMAIAFSISEQNKSEAVVPDEPNESANPDTVVAIQIRLPDGKKVSRKFLKENKIEDLQNYVKKESDNYQCQVVLSQNFPKKVFSDAAQTLEQCGFSKNTALIAEIKY
jgi:hypothetical protein